MGLTGLPRYAAQRFRTLRYDFQRFPTLMVAPRRRSQVTIVIYERSLHRKRLKHIRPRHTAQRRRDLACYCPFIPTLVVSTMPTTVIVGTGSASANGWASRYANFQVSSFAEQGLRRLFIGKQ